MTNLNKELRISRQDTNDLLNSVSFQQIVTLNPEIHYIASRHMELRSILTNSCVTIDSQLMHWMCRYKGIHGINKISGSQLIFDTAEHCQKNRKRMFLLGDTKENNDLAVKILIEKFSVRSMGYSPKVLSGEENISGLESAIENFKPDYIFVGLGCPKQEIWIDKNAAFLKENGVVFAVGCGGAIGMLAGSEKRAPVWMSNYGLEWFWRILQNPRRLSRLPRVIVGAIGFAFTKGYA